MMPGLTIIPDGDGALPQMRKHIEEGTLIHVQELTVTGLPGGMTSGNASVGIFVDLPDGRAVFVETSLSLFLSAADALKARHGDPRKGQRGLGTKGGQG
jgi:hypothetical protein